MKIDAIDFTDGTRITSADGLGGGGGASLGGGLVLLDEVVLTADATHVEFADIPAGYAALWVVGSLRCDLAVTHNSPDLQVGNGSVDTGANYEWAFEGTTGTSNASDTAVSLAHGVTGSSAAAGSFSIVDLLILDYDDASRQRVMRYQTGGAISIYNGTGRWKNTADAIDVVRVTAPSGSNMVVGSRLRLYGVKGGTDVAGLYEQTIGDGVTTAYTVNHGLGSEAVAVAVYDLTGTDPLQVEAQVELVDADNVRVTFSAAPGTDEAKVVVVGGVASEPVGPVAATGGDNTYDAGGYRYHEFTSSGTLDVTAGGPVEVLCVGGGSGGNGGQSGVNFGHGGAGGTVREESIVLPAGTYAAHVGRGGLGEYGTATAAGGQSSWFAGRVVATGGFQNPARGRTGPGNDDYAGITHSTGTDGAGGAGAGAQASGKDGGAGVVAFDGNTYGGGGGGGAGSGAGTGGTGGGGAGATSSNDGTSGTANTGGGGGGCGATNTGGNGADGIVVVRYPI